MMKKWLDVLDAKISQINQINHYEDDDDGSDGQDDEDRIVEGPGPQAPLNEDLETNEKKKHWYTLRRTEHRWKKLLQGFHTNTDGKDSYDCTKIPDLWDMTTFYLLRHRSTFESDEISALE